MQLGMIGLGRMGGNIVRRLMKNGHSCVVYDTQAASVTQLVSEGATPSADLKDFLSKLNGPKAVWVMLPAGPITESTITTLGEMMSAFNIDDNLTIPVVAGSGLTVLNYLLNVL